MNIFEYLFPRYAPDEPWRYMFLGRIDNRFFIAERGSMLAGMESRVVKMRKEHVELLNPGCVNEIIFDNQLKLI